jgi:hypothetical protein
MRSDLVPRNKSVAFWITAVLLGVMAAVIVGAVLWAVPMWMWTFVLGVGVGVFGYRRWAQAR